MAAVQIAHVRMDAAQPLDAFRRGEQADDSRMSLAPRSFSRSIGGDGGIAGGEHRGRPRSPARSARSAGALK